MKKNGKYIFQNGLSSLNTHKYDDLFYLFVDNCEDTDKFIIKDGFDFFDTFGNIHLIYYRFATKIFGNYDDYLTLLEKSILLFQESGISSDSRIDIKNFQNMIDNMPTEYFPNSDKNKMLFLHDCYFLIDTLQTQLFNVEQNFINFYISLESITCRKFSDELRYTVSGSNVNICYGHLYNVFIYMCSVFDILTKILYEYQFINIDFNKYNKLASQNKLFNHIKHINFKDKTGTISESSETINTIRTIRDEIIHNAGWESHPKVHVAFKGDEICEKYILFPDMKNGNIVKHINRKRFFSLDIKINSILHKIILDALNKINKTILDVFSQN